MTKNTWLSIFGFLFAGIGVLSLIFSLFGANFMFLTWMDGFGALAAGLMKLVLILTGVVMIVLSQVDWQKEIEESQPND